MEGHIHHPSLTCSLLVLVFLFLFVVECSDAIASPWVSRQHEGLPSSVKEQTLALSLSSHGLHEASHGGNVSFARLLPVLFQQYLYVLLLKDTTQEVSSVTTAFNDTVAITELLASSKQLLSALYCNISTSILNVGNNNVKESILSYHQTNKLDITLGIVPSTLQNAGDIMIVDPINTTTSTRRVDPYVVYLFATMEEQFYVAASSIADSSSSSSALPRVSCVVRQHDGQNDAEILFALRQSFATFQVPIETTVISATGNLTDSMSPTQMNVLVGLTSDDVPDLVAFLDANPGATALVNFDELTLLYDAFSTAYEGVYRPSMDRLLYATNLPRWSFAPTNPRATVLSLFFDVSSVNLRTPAALRTYISAVFMDGIAYRVSRTYSRDNLPKGLYKSSVFTVDYHLSFGPYTKYCPYPSINQLSCLVNYGARDVSLWPLSSAFKSKVGSVYGPVSAQLRMMRADGTTVAKDPHLSAVLIFVFCVMAAMAVCTTLVGYGCAKGFFDVEDEVVTILHASLQQFHKSHENQSIDAALEAYSSAVDNLVTHHACMEVESNEGGFVVVSRSASTAVTLALELQLELVRICALRHCVGAVVLQIGIHTASCPVTHALDDGDRSAAWPAVASAALLAACVSKLASGSAVLATRWTLQTLVQTMGVRVRACSLGSYQLNEEDSVIEVYSIHSCSRWFHRELSWRGSEGILSSNPLSSVSGEM